MTSTQEITGCIKEHCIWFAALQPEVGRVSAGARARLKRAGECQNRSPLMKRKLGALIPLLLFTAACLAADAPAEERKLVGTLGVPSAIEITGAKTFTADDLRFALAGSYAYLLAAHPAAPFASYATAVETALVKGYRNAGFRDARVTAAVSEAGDRLRVQIEEGRKFVLGDIRITGVAAALADDLAKVLTTKSAPAPETLADRVTDFIEERAAPKRKAALEKIALKLNAEIPRSGTDKPLGVAVSVTASADAITGGGLLKKDKRTDPFWEAGDPFPFETMTANAAATELRSVLAARGKSLMGVKAGMTAADATGRVNLAVQLTDAPDAIVGNLTVTGHKRDTAAEILAATGLKKGARFTGDTIRRANLALWDSARFLNFDLTPTPRDGGSGEVDIAVEVEECAEMQPLREPLTRVQQAVVRLSGWMSAEFSRREISLRLSDDLKNEIALAFSPRAGFAVVLRAQAAQMLGVHGGVEKGLAVATAGERAAAQEFGNKDGTLTLKFGVTSSPKERPVGSHTKSCDFGASYVTSSASGDDHAAVRTEIIIAPAVLASIEWARSGRGVKYEDGMVRAEFGDGAEKGWIRFAEQSGELTEAGVAQMAVFGRVASVSLGVKPGEVARLREGIEDARRGRTPAALAENSILELVATAPAVAQFSTAIFNEKDLKKVGLTARLTEKVLASFLTEFFKAPENADGRTQFFIPPDPTAPTSVLASMLHGMLFQWAQELWPPDAWPAKLGREIFYVAAGHTAYTGQVLGELYDDPRMGPFGSHATAQLLSKVDPAMARKFLERARDRSSVEDLRRELELLLDVRGKRSAILGGIVAEFGKLEADSLALLAGSLGPEFAAEMRAWREKFATTRTGDLPSAAVLLPYLLRGWERGGRAKFVAEIEAILAKDAPGSRR